MGFLPCNAEFLRQITLCSGCFSHWFATAKTIDQIRDTNVLSLSLSLSLSSCPFESEVAGGKKITFLVQFDFLFSVNLEIHSNVIVGLLLAVDLCWQRQDTQRKVWQRQSMNGWHWEWSFPDSWDLMSLHFQCPKKCVCITIMCQFSCGANGNWNSILQSMGKEKIQFHLWWYVTENHNWMPKP